MKQIIRYVRVEAGGKTGSVRRITIPIEFAEELDIEKGDNMRIEMDADHARLMLTKAD
jgi:bifunctional DNA-binding transcriptional regulator/antitoxin component of YhaV-PrlF toxin-antitoxin module